MEEVRKTDPTYVGFIPKTAAEAVDRFIRCRRNGLRAMMVPECLIKCARALTGSELQKFENWVINPHRDLDDLDLVPSLEINKSNDAVYAENLRKAEAACPSEQEDEKAVHSS